MNNTQRKLSAAVWSKLEALARLRKAVQKELEFINSISPQLSANKLEGKLVEIDDFSAVVSNFLADLNHKDEEALDQSFSELTNRYDLLVQTVESMLGR